MHYVYSCDGISAIGTWHKFYAPCSRPQNIASLRINRLSEIDVVEQCPHRGAGKRNLHVIDLRRGALHKNFSPVKGNLSCLTNTDKLMYHGFREIIIQFLYDMGGNILCMTLKFPWTTQGQVTIYRNYRLNLVSRLNTQGRGYLQKYQ